MNLIHAKGERVLEVTFQKVTGVWEALSPIHQMCKCWMSGKWHHAKGEREAVCISILPVRCQQILQLYYFFKVTKFLQNKYFFYDFIISTFLLKIWILTSWRPLVVLYLISNLLHKTSLILSTEQQKYIWSLLINPLIQWVNSSAATGSSSSSVFGTVV